MDVMIRGRRLRILLCILAGIFVVTILFFVLNTLDSTFVSYLDFKSSHKEAVPHWRRFTNNECGYVVEFPSRPFENPITLNNHQNVVSYRQFASALGSNQAFMVATLVTSVTNTYSDEQI